MKYTVEISDTFAEQLVPQVLLEDYRFMQRDIERLREKDPDDLAAFEKADLADWQDLSKAMETVLDYYSFGWRSQK